MKNEIQYNTDNLVIVDTPTEQWQIDVTEYNTRGYSEKLISEMTDEEFIEQGWKWIRGDWAWEGMGHWP
jgi:hypothetical protein